jgi:hypothetical protein
MPVDLSQPNFQDSKMQRNKTMDMPTLNASARIIRLDLGAPSVSPRNIKNSAVDKAANTPKKAMAINMFMFGIIL